MGRSSNLEPPGSSRCARGTWGAATAIVGSIAAAAIVGSIAAAAAEAAEAAVSAIGVGLNSVS